MNLPVPFKANATDLTTSPDCLLNYNHYDVICHVINVCIYRKLAPGPPPSENPRSAPDQEQARPRHPENSKRVAIFFQVPRDPLPAVRWDSELSVFSSDEIQ